MRYTVYKILISLFFISAPLHSILCSDETEYKGELPAQSGQFFKTKNSSLVIVADCRKDSPIGKMTSTALQGLINQDSAQVYLFLSDHHVSQLNDTERKYTILQNKISENQGLSSLFTHYNNAIRKIYIWNPDEDWTWNMALMLSAQNKGVPLTNELFKSLSQHSGWKGEVIDLTNKWENKKSAYDWAIKELMPFCHKNILFSTGLRDDWKKAPWTLYDYVVASKGFSFWLNDTLPKEQNIIKEICVKGKYNTGTIVMGYAQSGDDLLKTVNEYGIGYIVSDYYANGSFWCSYPNKSFKQPKGIPRKVENGKVYVSIIFSDGDNLQFDQNSLYNMWENDSLRGLVPVGTTLAPGLQEINPFLMEWFYKRKTDNDELVAGPSGYQFIYGRDYKQSGYDEWLRNNKAWLASGGFHTACLWHTTYGTEVFDKYIETCGLQGIFDGDDKTGIAYKDGVIIMNQGEHLVREGELYNALSKVQIKPDAPVFVNVYPIAADYGRDGGIARLKREIERLEKDFPARFEYMLPKDLTASAAEYFKK